MPPKTCGGNTKMADQPRPLVAGNWKMNGLRASIAELEKMIADTAPEHSRPTDLMICPPATLCPVLPRSPRARRSPSARRIAMRRFRARLPAILSAEMITDAGASAVIVGPFGAARAHGESDELVKAKAEAAARAGLIAILCVGETSEERSAGATFAPDSEAVRRIASDRQSRREPRHCL